MQTKDELEELLLMSKLGNELIIVEVTLQLPREEPETAIYALKNNRVYYKESPLFRTDSTVTDTWALASRWDYRKMLQMILSGEPTKVAFRDNDSSTMQLLECYKGNEDYFNV